MSKLHPRMIWLRDRERQRYVVFDSLSDRGTCVVNLDKDQLPLSRARARTLIKVLQRFVDTGSVVNKEKLMRCEFVKDGRRCTAKKGHSTYRNGIRHLLEKKATKIDKPDTCEVCGLKSCYHCPQCKNDVTDHSKKCKNDVTDHSKKCTYSLPTVARYTCSACEVTFAPGEKHECGKDEKLPFLRQRVWVARATLGGTTLKTLFTFKPNEEDVLAAFALEMGARVQVPLQFVSVREDYIWSREREEDEDSCD